jgi:hypothetical protein
MVWHIIQTASGENIERKVRYYPVETEDGNVQVRRQGRLSLECNFKHEKSDQIWKITYCLRKKKNENGERKYVNVFNIHAPDKMVPRNYHKLDTVMKVVKNTAFHDRKNTTGGVSFSTFKCRLSEVAGKEFAEFVAKEFADRIKQELTAKA